MVMLRKGEIWVSLLEVEALGREDGFEPGERAFVNVAILATSVETAEEKMAKELGALGFHVVRFEGTETVQNRSANRPVSAQLLRLARQAQETNSAALGTFHSWEGQG